MTLEEDAGQARRGRAPQTNAVLNNIVVSLVVLSGGLKILRVRAPAGQSGRRAKLGIDLHGYQGHHHDFRAALAFAAFVLFAFVLVMQVLAPGAIPLLPVLPALIELLRIALKALEGG